MRNLIVAAAALAVALASPADAATQFNITGDYSATFTIADGQLPDSADDAIGAAYYDQPFADVSGLADFVFYSAANGGGLEISDFNAGMDIFEGIGVPLYSGPAANPVFTPGVYQLSQLGGVGHYTVSISAVPEPASWMLLIAGFGMTGWVLRNPRRRVIPVVTV